MPIRYRLLSFDSKFVRNPQATLALLEDLGGFERSPLAELASHQWYSVLEHALACGAKSILLQEAVRDPDFLEEYEAFYSKQQKEVSKLCRRLHLFSLEIPSGIATQDAEAILTFVDHASTETGSYLGFITLRPLRHAPVGASILKDLPNTPVTCKDVFPVHIAGAEFAVSGTPYLQQDNAVGACAQVSIWVALRTLRKRLGNSAYSPAELTVAATKHFTVNRVFPGRDGLTTHQMLEAIRSAGHDPLILELRNKCPQDTANEAARFATPYLESGLPVIIGLNHPGGGHAVVAIGFASCLVGKTFPDKLIIHNDNSGCYQNLPLLPPTAADYALSQTMALITPLPEGICMSAAEAELLAETAIQFAAPFVISLPPIADFLSKQTGQNKTTDCVLRVLLSTRHSFRHWAANAVDIDAATKSTYRTAELPRFIWVAEIHDAKLFQRGAAGIKSRLGEVVLDASADARHGDGLLFTRLSGLLVDSQAPDNGILVVERNGLPRIILAITAPVSHCQVEPWK
jgi:hypothetical protein